MKAIIINNEIKYDEDALSLADMSYEIGEIVEAVHCNCDSECWYYFIYAKQDILIDGIIAVIKGEAVQVNLEEIEVIA